MISGDFPPAFTGVGDYTHQLVESLAALGVAVDVFTGAMEGDAGGSSGGWGPGVIRRVLREIDRPSAPPVVHIQYPALAYGRKPAINLLPAIVKLLRPRCKVIVTMHEFRSMRLRWRCRVVPMLLAADAVVLPDELDRSPVARWTRRGRVVSIPLGPNILPQPMSAADRASWRADLGLSGEDPVIVFFGGVYEHKGIRELIAAVRGLRSRQVRAQLLMVGEPDPGGRFQAEVEEVLRDGWNEGWARWLTGATSQVVSRCLHISDLAVLPFHSGAMANRASLLVVLGHGLPAVTTRTAATPASFGDGTGMALVPARDATALEACVGDLLRSPERRRALAACGLAYAGGFSWDVVARKTVELYQSLGAGMVVPSEGALPAACR
jgi:glycosyltransferase involved in cell wall biosynthesis